MSQILIPKSKVYDLEERTYQFASRCRSFVRQASASITALEDGKQLVRASGSVAANYIEANEAISKKDFRYRILIARKEAKESRLWLRLLHSKNEIQENQRLFLVEEAEQLGKILAAILKKTD